ncbi:putative transmembrane protein [Rhizoctonia solani 123E]|uniref:Putative transmembrane protein n=1 Tax=Rhizoctonia solani 123E TaxID=1423351 RepID=A0A074RJ18_9AGAM|nr:putative transmembrane protein [Rhizoctonia solani 123E]
MQTFGRLLSVLTFLLSLGFFAHALPAAPNAGLAVRAYGSPAPSNGGYSKPTSGGDVLNIMADLKVKVDAHVEVLAKAVVVADVKARVDLLVADIKAVATVCTGVKLNVDAEVTAKIAVTIVAIISVRLVSYSISMTFLTLLEQAIVKVCAALSVKIGVQVCLALWAQIDVALHLLILTLNVCISGFLQILIKLCVNLDAEVIAALKVVRLDLCVKILAIVKVFVGVN